MRVLLDANILISALLIQVGHPAAIYRAWQEGAFTLCCVRRDCDNVQIMDMIPDEWTEFTVALPTVLTKS